MKTDRTICRDAVSRAPRQAKTQTFLWRLRCWMNRAAPEERYLAGASDHADLERRMREIERANRGPALITFNH